ncbi:portal protein [Gordonia phage Trax]|uniref:Portal protein n=1 Tax=Gordonia phage Trax TaxID=2591121 RepID=A0A515MGW0_9CAUD|nr:portal protein [Gordonia phage Trax]QDM55900.1 portal protein [Gordonia phage Trax]
MNQRITYQDWRQPEQLQLLGEYDDQLTDPKEIVKKAESLWRDHEVERDRLAKIDQWYKGEQEPHNVRGATPELQELLALSRTPWLGLVVTTIAQAMYVDGYRSPVTGDDVPGPWRIWNDNGMHKHQIAIHRAALGYGYAYALVEAGVSPLTQEPTARIKGMSPKRMFAVYDDPAVDDWPVYALRVDRAENERKLFTFYDSTFAHSLTLHEGKWTIHSTAPHGAGVVPVVRYTNALDLDGNAPGEVEPFIVVAARVDKSSFDRLLTQHYNSWKKFYVSGMTDITDAEEARLAKMRIRQDDVIVAESVETKFGTIDETDLNGFINVINADVEHLAAVSQLPSHLLTGKLVNLSSDALSAARAPLTQKVYERQVSFGASHAQLLRLASAMSGDLSGASDVLARVSWQDMEIRSLAQAADALGKMAVQLGIPRIALWRMLPGVTQDDIDEWKEHLLDDDPTAVYLRELNATGSQQKDDGDDQTDSEENGTVDPEKNSGSTSGD